MSEFADNLAPPEVAGRELKYKLDFTQTASYPALFQFLEDNKENIGVASFGISITTLEDVFLQTAVDDQAPAVKELDADDDPVSLPLSQLRASSQGEITRLQYAGLFKKKLLQLKRDVGSIFGEVAIPVIILLWGIAILKIRFVEDIPPFSFSPSKIPNYYFFLNDFSFRVNNQAFDQSSLLGNFAFQNFTRKTLSADFNRAYAQIFEGRGDDLYYSYFVNSADDRAINYTVFLNSTAPVAALVANNEMTNAILKTFKGKNAMIQASLWPFKNTASVRRIDVIIDGIVIVLFISIAVTFISSSLIVPVIREAESGSKHMQLISGVGLFPFWLANLIIDYLKYLLFVGLVLLIMKIFEVGFFLTSENFGCVVLLFLAFGVAMTLMVYFISLFFAKPFNGQIFTFIFCFLTSFFLSMLVFMLKTNPKTHDLANDVLQNILRVLPHFALVNGLLNIIDRDI